MAGEKKWIEFSPWKNLTGHLGTVKRTWLWVYVCRLCHRWITKTAAYTAIRGEAILADTDTVGAFTITLPISPEAGDTVKIKDAKGSWATNNVTVGRNGEKIRGSAADFTLAVNWAEAEFVYVDSATGWIVKLISDGFGAPTELTIDNGEVTVSGDSKWRFHSIRTEEDAASDDLVTVNGGNVGDILLLQAENDARTVVNKDGASLMLRAGADFTFNNVRDKLMAICISSGVWHELIRSSGGN